MTNPLLDPNYWKDLIPNATPAQLRELNALLPPAPPAADAEKLAAEGSLAEFMKQAWPVVEPAVALEWGPHLDAMCLHLEAVENGLIKKLLIQVPPGCTKSIAVGVVWPTWSWIKKPWLRWLTGSNDRSLAIRDALTARSLIASEWFQERWGGVFQMTSDQNEKVKYENSRRGFRQIVSVGSRVTGKKGDRLVLDDANDAEKMNSVADVERAIRWHDKAWFNRVNHPMQSAHVYIGQRCGVRDIMGHAERRADFVKLCIPEQFEPERRCTTVVIDPKTGLPWTDWRTEKGEWLRPTRFGPAQKAEAVKTLGMLGWAGQHQQRPTDPEGSLFKLHWFKTYRLTPLLDGFILLDGTVIVRGDCVVFTVIDPATGKGSTGDFTALVTLAATPCGKLLILDAINERIPIEKLVGVVKRLQNQWGPEFVAVEANGFQTVVVSQLRKQTSLAVKEVYPNLGSGPQKSKRVRAQKAMIMAEAGLVWIPADATANPWLEGFLDELEGFTGDDGGIDNQVDAFSYSVHLNEDLNVGGGGAAPRVIGGRGMSSRPRLNLYG